MGCETGCILGLGCVILPVGAVIHRPITVSDPVKTFPGCPNTRTKYQALAILAPKQVQRIEHPVPPNSGHSTVPQVGMTIPGFPLHYDTNTDVQVQLTLPIATSTLYITPLDNPSPS